MEIDFPASVTDETDLSVSPFIYEQKNNDGELERFAYCIIPDTPAARDLLLENLDERVIVGELPEDETMFSAGSRDISPMDDCGDYPCGLFYDEELGGVVCLAPPCEGGGGGSGDGYVPWPPMPWDPWDPDEHWPPGGGGGSPPPPPPPGENPDDPCYIDPDGPMQLPHPECLASPCNWPFPPTLCEVEPCETNDVIIDDLAMQEELAQAWFNSYGSDNNTLPPSQRDEMLIAVINDNGNYSSVIFEAQSVSSCHMSGVNTNLSGSQSQNAVALIHTHPFTPGQEVKDQRCLDWRGYPPGSTYDDDPSDEDYHALNSINIQLGEHNIGPVPMIVIDAENMYTLYQTQTVENHENLDLDHHFDTHPYERCGF